MHSPFAAEFHQAFAAAPKREAIGVRVDRCFQRRAGVDPQQLAVLHIWRRIP